MPLESVQLLPLAAGVAVARAVRAVAQVEPTCKWPNDILVGDRKLAGMLLEASAQQDGVDFVVLGIGINVNQTVFPAEIAHTATSLRNETGVAVERVRLFREVLTAFESLYLRLAAEGPDAVLPPWLELCPSVGTELEVDLRGTMVQGTMDGVGRDGALLLRTAEGQRAFYAGDVTIRKTVHHAPGN
jgi:BirA family biotin operon repressor/biotin-[acetyl-CoA-carboxylase] ligase